ncbi:hypothetical protein DFH08DRAFT_799835 [Mycena albidolilacea]|uniref:Uncharacterized protein n=1 Tax=Mycena albidolilacea TaxID=1033008 RepID=A0AAD7AMF0_9AGAR|nr:hypothetical protein DFH08DRAFT_799835 [Mycena albidolilacea]
MPFDKDVYPIRPVVSNTRITWYNISAPWVSKEKHMYLEPNSLNTPKLKTSDANECAWMCINHLVWTRSTRNRALFVESAESRRENDEHDGNCRSSGKEWATLQ